MSASKKRTPEEEERQRNIVSANDFLKLKLAKADKELVWAQEKADACIAKAQAKFERIKDDPAKVLKLGEDDAAEQIKIGQDRYDQRVEAANAYHKKTMEELGVTE